MCVTGAEAAYEETAKMAVEAALALVFDGPGCPGLLAGGGCLTSAACMGTALIHRLQNTGIRFEVMTDASRGPAEGYVRDAIARFHTASAEAART